MRQISDEQRKQSESAIAYMRQESVEARRVQSEIVGAHALRQREVTAKANQEAVAWRQHENQKLVATKTAEKQGEAAVAASNQAKERIAQRAVAVRRQQEADLVANIKRFERERLQIATQNANAIARLAKTEADSRIREGRRAATALITSLREQAREARQLSQQQQAAAAGTGRGAAFLAGAAGGVAALVGVSAISEIRNAGAAWLDYASKLESTRIAFTTMMGSAQLAEAHLKELQQFALKTPFQFGELIDASQRMQALGFTAQQVIPVLTDVGNAVAAAGGGEERLQRVIKALGDMQSKGRVATQELNQLAENGISGWRVLEAQLGKSRAELVKMVEAGQISSKVFLDAFQKFSQQNFGGLMEAQSKTFTGAMSNIKDALLQTSATAFAPLYARLSQLAQEMSNTSTKSTEFLENMKKVGSVLMTIWDGAVEAFYVLRDVYRIGSAVIVATVMSIVESFFALINVWKSAYHEGAALGKLLTGDLKGAMDENERANRALEEAVNSLTRAAASQQIVAQELGRAWTEAAARARAAGIAAQVAAAAMSLVPQTGGSMALPAGLQPGSPTGVGAGRGGRAGGGRSAAVARISEGQKLLNQLTEEHNRLTAKTNDLTKVQITEKEILDSKYKGLTASLREQILEQAQQIDIAAKTADLEKRKEQATEKIRSVLENQTKAIYDATHADKDWNAEVTALEAELKKLNLTMDESTKKMLLDNAARLKAISLAQQLVDIEKETADALDRERDSLRELEHGQLTHVDTATIFIAKKIAEAEAVGGVTAKMREYFALLIKIAAKQDEIAAADEAKAGFRRAAKDAAKKAGKAGGWQEDEEDQEQLSVWDEALGALEERMGRAQTAAQQFHDAMSLYVVGAFHNMADAATSAVEAWILYGGSLGKALKQALAAELAHVAASAAIQAALHAAYAIGSLAFGNFAAAAQHGLAAAKFAAVAALTGIAARGLASSAAASQSGGVAAGSAFQSATRAGSGSTAGQPTTIDVNRRNSSMVFQPQIQVTVVGQATEGFQYMVEKVAIKSARENGPFRKLQNGEDV